MKISFSANNIMTCNPSFKSIANPIKPFTIKTSKGDLFVREFEPQDLSDENFVSDFLTFSYENFASMTNDPFWLSFNDPEHKLMWEKIKKEQTEELTAQLKSGDKNLTLLIARDEKNKIRAACFSYGFNDIPHANQDVCYIDTVAVDKNFREQNVGRILINKTLESAKNAFTDVFLTGEILATMFYKKLGFKELNPNETNQNKIIKRIATIRDDYPEYINFLTKPLQPNKPRWYDKPIHNQI